MNALTLGGPLPLTTFPIGAAVAREQDIARSAHFHALSRPPPLSQRRPASGHRFPASPAQLDIALADGRPARINRSFARSKATPCLMPMFSFQGFRHHGASRQPLPAPRLQRHARKSPMPLPRRRLRRDRATVIRSPACGIEHQQLNACAGHTLRRQRSVLHTRYCADRRAARRPTNHRVDAAIGLATTTHTRQRRRRGARRPVRPAADRELRLRQARALIAQQSAYSQLCMRAGCKLTLGADAPPLRRPRPRAHGVHHRQQHGVGASS